MIIRYIIHPTLTYGSYVLKLLSGTLSTLHSHMVPMYYVLHYPPYTHIWFLCIKMIIRYIIHPTLTYGSYVLK